MNRDSLFFRLASIDNNPIRSRQDNTAYVPVQNRDMFFQELEKEVRKHRRYLEEIERMDAVNIPKAYYFAKRSMDLFLGILGLLMLSPLILFVAILIKLDSPGPVIYIQERVGKDGKTFNIYKFRTMKEDAEAKTGPVWVDIYNDPRITSIGKKLRDSKIDEIPQLINLIKGDMSIVGPRPERPRFVNDFIKCIPGYRHRLDVLPGITGLAQLKIGYDRNAKYLIKKLRFEITYIKKMCLSMDLRIMLDTFIYALKGKL